jgi:hypothetical protein
MEHNQAVQKMRERYAHIHPLIFHRSVERAKNAVELFDILETFLDKYPLIWDNELRNWVRVPDNK